MRNLVRPSRDGDQFHYLWAARRCLRLLSPQADLVSIAIEGSSPCERPHQSTAPAGEEVIDIAEYFGDERLSSARLVRYMQLKHSSLRSACPWSASGLRKTLEGFSSRYKDLLKRFSRDDLAKRFEFCFVTNRPISSVFRQAVDNAAQGTAPYHPNELKKLEDFTGMIGADLSFFCRLIHFDDCKDGYWDQRNILFQNIGEYLPDFDVDAPVQLKELVTRKALSESTRTPTITKIDVLRVLRTDETRLYPVPCLIKSIDNAVPRTQESDLVQIIVGAESRPIIIHALAGIGKSVFASRLVKRLPRNSVSILYDCFGNGHYRSPTGYRHRHHHALVQIANELAAKRLCHPLIPTIHSDTSSYIRAFIYRLEQATTILRLADSHAVLCIVIDAADNAQLAAEEAGHSRSFAQDLLRETLPNGVRLVVLCRTHRQDILDPPPQTLRIKLEPFSRAETAAHLNQRFPTASEHDINEFHRLTSKNPRLQSYALARGLSLVETLRLLGPNPTTVEGSLGSLLNDAIKTLQYRVGPVEKERIGNICTGLAVLPPLIPIAILSELSYVSQEAIRSFILDIGRPLLLSDDTIQFLDEPVETWFREHFKPRCDEIVTFVEILKPLAVKSSYVASTLPKLMLESGQFSELVELALTSAALPDTSALERHNVSLQRLQFALKASLRLRRYVDAAKLAMKAGGETAGEDRLYKLIQANTDLSSLFLQRGLLQDIASRKILSSDWSGSHYVYEAGLLSGCQLLYGEARSRLRMAHEWLRHWSRLTSEERNNESIDYNDIAELSLAELNIHGAEAAADNIGRWRPNQVSFQVGRILSRRLIDHSRFAELDALAVACRDNLYLILAIIVELRSIHRTPPAEIVDHTYQLVSYSQVKLKDVIGSDIKRTVLQTVTSLVEASLKLSLCSHSDAAVLLTRYLPSSPPRALSSRFEESCRVLLRAYCLRAGLRGEILELGDLAHSELKAELARERGHGWSMEARTFKRDIGALLPWYQLSTEVFLGKIDSEMVPTALGETRKASESAAQHVYEDQFHRSNQIALIWFELLNFMQRVDAHSIEGFVSWTNGLDPPLFTPTLAALARQCAQRAETVAIALHFASEAFTLTRNDRVDAESKSISYTELSRSVLAISAAEAKAYFDEAVAIANKVGDENLSRWDAILDLGERAARHDQAVPETAYQFARCAELTYDYVVRDKYFDWASTVTTLSSLCPSSSMAILSRWRDRRFGSMGRILPVAIQTLIDQNSVDPRDVLALVGFEAEWDYLKMLDSVLARCENRSERESASSLFFRYMKLARQPSTVWKGLRKITTKYGLSLPDIDTYITFTDHEERTSNQERASFSHGPSIVDEEAEDTWDELFYEVDLTTTDGLLLAYTSFRSRPAPWNRSHFFAEAFRRVPSGGEAAFITAIGTVSEFNLYHLRNVLENIPDSWKRRPLVRQSLKSTLKVFLQRYCMDVTNNRDYRVLPFDLACSLTAAREEDLFDIVLDAIADSPELADSNRLFSLVGLLKSKLGHHEALEALTFGLSLYEPLLEDRDGDGHWSKDLAPPDSIQASIAGYIYAALASPIAKRRWEAAHSILGLCALGRTVILRHLVGLIKTRSGGPFVDSRLPFYELHALQWLMITFARAATEFPNTLAEFLPDLVDWALHSQFHVLIEQFAGRAALTLIKNGVVPAESGLKERLSEVNTACIAHGGVSSSEHVVYKAQNSGTTVNGNEFYFGIDIAPYWLEPLGRVFGLSQSEIEAEVLKVIRNELDYVGKGAWSEDERARRKLYGHWQTHASHGSYPSADDHHTYLSYHAMMIAAGKLLTTLPSRRNTEWDEQDEFSEWLSRHDLSRKDGRWLADRRDPVPLEWPKWRDRKKGDPAYGGITPTDFQEALGTANTLNVWGYWSIADSTHVQSVSVRSALVCPGRSMALLRALSTVNEEHLYLIPRFGDQFEIDRAGFTLKGWIEDNGHNCELDAKDPWSAGVRYPPPTPSVETVNLMALETDLDKRLWRDGAKKSVINSQVWGHLDVTHQNKEIGEGTRVQASISFVNDFLNGINKDLIIGVRIEMKRQNSRFGWRQNDDEEYSRDTKFYLVRSDGQFTTLP